MDPLALLSEDDDDEAEAPPADAAAPNTAGEGDPETERGEAAGRSPSAAKRPRLSEPAPAAARCAEALSFEDLQTAGYRPAPSLLESETYLRDAAGQEARRPKQAAPEAEETCAQTEEQDVKKEEEETAADELAVATQAPPVEVTGSGQVPEPWATFQGDLPAALLGPLLAAGFGRPTPIQSHAMPILASGRDMVGVAQTGSGKTLAYLLPCMSQLLAKPGEVRLGLAWSPPVLILGPTRELVCQIAGEAERFRESGDINTAAVYGGASRGAQLATLRGQPHIVVATPGRLVDFLLADQAAISVRDVRFLVLDEADRMLDDGFEPQIRRISTEASLRERQTMMFSATWPAAVQQLAGEFLRDPLRVCVGGARDVPLAGATVTHDVVFCEERDKARILTSLLRGRPRARAVVFVATKRACREMSRSVRGGVPGRVEAIHGDRSQEEREAALAAFRDGSARVLFATDVAGRGLDVPGVELVVNVDAPQSAEDYVHRVGRTGRAGQKGLAISLLAPADAGAARPILEVIRRSGARVPPELERRVGPGLVPDQPGASKTCVMTRRGEG